MVIVNQPTHPAFYEDDIRHHKCNVCLSEYTCPPPTRGELMETFTGPEIAASLFEGRLIASRDVFSVELEAQLQTMNPFMRARSSYEHWIRGVYVITRVESDDEYKVIPLSQPSSVQGLLSRLDANLELTFQGQRLRLVRGESLAHVGPEEDLGAAFRALQTPARVVLQAVAGVTCADVHIVAVNIFRKQPAVVRPDKYNHIYTAVHDKYPNVANVEVSHYIGGPVDEGEITTCIVLGGARRGWTVVPKLKDALILALARARNQHGEAQGDLSSGQTVCLQGLVARPDLNGRKGMALRFLPDAGRWEVQLCSGEGVKVKPANIQGLEGRGGRVMVFWGDARWSRAQLLGEIARGHWGLCRATVGEFVATSPQEVYEGTMIPGRLAYAPISAMTDEMLSGALSQEGGEGGVAHVEGGDQVAEMERAYRAGARLAAEGDGGEGDGDEDDMVAGQ
jgi:hypothetical protein